MKYKVGDTVRVKNNLEIGVPHGKFRVTKDMGDYRGHESKITEARHDVHGYKLAVDDGLWSWSETMLEPLADDCPPKHNDVFDAARHGFEELSRWDGEKVKPLSIHTKEGGFPAFKTDQADNGLPHTPHYMNGLIETIDVIKMALTPEEFRGFLKGNVLKYQIRAPHKHETPDEDYQKAKDYYDLLEGLQ